MEKISFNLLKWKEEPVLFQPSVDKTVCHDSMPLGRRRATPPSTRINDAARAAVGAALPPLEPRPGALHTRQAEPSTAPHIVS
jgi:hypothetical protein